jgi:Ca2+-binding EF-hand superfamily protein
MFKFFDIQNKGKVDFDQWYRAMEKVGIVMDRPVSTQNHLKLVVLGSIRSVLEI